MPSSTNPFRSAFNMAYNYAQHAYHPQASAQVAYGQHQHQHQHQPAPSHHSQAQYAQHSQHAQIQAQARAQAHAQAQAQAQAEYDERERERARHSRKGSRQDAGTGTDADADADARGQGDEVPPSERPFNIPDYYRVESVVGEGAYGVVCGAVHVPSGTQVAIKRIMPFEHAMFAQRTLREIKLLRHFSHENIIAILDIILPSSYEDFTEVYLVQELMETDLHRVIRTQALSDDHCQYFLYQTVRGLKALHTANVLHRDLKPSNLLLNANCDLKICDFGLARSAAAPPPDVGPNGGNGFMTEYVATRWYRAPEVMLSFQEYTKAIDVWSVGCILAEMINGKPLFPGRDYRDQLLLILDVTGTPTMDDFNEITSDKSRDYLREMQMTRRKHMREVCPTAHPLAQDFLARTLTFSPRKRITVEAALDHPYLQAYHDPSDEPSARPIEPEFFNFDVMDKKKEAHYKEVFKRLVWDEIQRPIPDYEG